MWQEVAEQIKRYDNFVLTTHVNPEGDAIGSEAALGAFLEDLGKTVTMVNSSVTPQNSAFLDPEGKIKVYPDDFSPKILDDADVIVILDVNNWSHLGAFGDAIKKCPKPRICIDHHQGGDEGFADTVVRDTKAAAAGLMVHDLIVYMKGELTPKIVDAIYSTIITDTGTFRFSNTDERVFRVAGDMTRRGAKPFDLHRQVFSKNWGAVKLLGSVLRTLDSVEDGKLAWIYVTREMFDAAGATYDDSDGLLDIVRAIGDVEFCLFFKEADDGAVRVSLRSNGKVDVYEIAKTFGGGGHRMASGMTVEGRLPEAIPRVIQACTKYIPR